MTRLFYEKGNLYSPGFIPTPLARQGENESDTITIISHTMHAGHEYYLEYETPSGDKGMYLLIKDQTHMTLSTPETTAITSEAGTVKLQIVDRYEGTIIAKSSVYEMTVTESINTAETDDDFEPNLFQQFLAEVESAATAAETSAAAAVTAGEDAEEAKDRAQAAALRAERAAAGAKSVSATVTQTQTGAKITVTDPDGTTEAVLLNGEDGTSPTITSEEVAGGHKITITDAEGTHIVNIMDGAQGPKGDTGKGIQSITKTSTAGLVDTYTITYTDGQTVTFTVTNGQDGTSPTITSEAIPGGHRLTITDTEGTHTVDIMDGIQGPKGDTGTGISSTVLNQDYTLTINFTDGTSYTTGPIRGIQGPQGAPGVSPTVTSTAIAGGHRISITDAAGVTTVDVMDGATGPQGPQGDAYVLTAQDKSDIADLVYAQLVPAAGQSF